MIRTPRSARAALTIVTGLALAAAVPARRPER